MTSIILTLAFLGQTPGRTDTVVLPAAGPTATTNPVTPSTPSVAKDWGNLGPAQFRWIDQSQGIWAYGQQFLDGPYKGMWRYGQKYQDPSYKTTTPAAPVQTATATPTTVPVQTVSYQPAPPVQYQSQQTAPAGDAYGFTNWLNGVRSQYGLGAVGYDPNLEAWAQQNNLQQNARGIGHFVMGPARRQNSAMGHYASIGAMWMASPAHRAALLDPTIRFVGLAGLGAYWTFSAY